MRAANDNNASNRGRGIAYAARLNANVNEYMADRISHATFSERNDRIWREIEADGVTREVQTVLRAR